MTENWVNCAILEANSAGLRTVLSSRLSHRELRSSLRESHSSPSLSAHTTMASSQGASVSSNSFSRWTSHDIFLLKCHFLLHILRFLFYFSDNIMADVASKQQTTALCLSTTVTRTRRHTVLTKHWQTWWETCAVPQNIQFSFSCSFLYSWTAQFNLGCMGPLRVVFRSLLKGTQFQAFKCVWDVTDVMLLYFALKPVEGPKRVSC
jgi:hypothetical protein